MYLHLHSFENTLEQQNLVFHGNPSANFSFREHDDNHGGRHGDRAPMAGIVISKEVASVDHTTIMATMTMSVATMVKWGHLTLKY
jgi:hypothetical protein